MRILNPDDIQLSHMAILIKNGWEPLAWSDPLIAARKGEEMAIFQAMHKELMVEIATGDRARQGYETIKRHHEAAIRMENHFRVPGCYVCGDSQKVDDVSSWQWCECSFGQTGPFTLWCRPRSFTARAAQRMHAIAAGRPYYLRDVRERKLTPKELQEIAIICYGRLALTRSGKSHKGPA